ncbi:MAG: tape measure protein [Patescibacteria group bacterium]
MANTTLSILVQAKDDASKALTRVNQSLGGLKEFAKKSAIALGAVGASAGALGIAALKSAGEYEQSRVAFETMLGSAEKATKFLKEMTAFAAKTPFELKDLEQASKQLLAYGSTQDNVLTQLKSLGDVAAGVGMDKLPQLITAFGQVQSKTRLMGEELLQFTEAGVPMLGTLAKQFGVTEAEISKMVSKGQVGFKDVEIAMASLSGEGGKFQDLMSRQSDTLVGKISNLQDAWNMFLRGAGAQFIEWAKQGVDLLIWFVNEGIPLFLGKIQGLQKGFGDLVAEFEKKTGIITQLKDAFGSVWKTVQDELMPSLQRLDKAMRPLYPFLEALAGLIAQVLVLALKAFIEALVFLINLVVQIISKLTEWTAIIMEQVGPAIDFMRSAIETLSGPIQRVIDGFNRVATAAREAFAAASRVAGNVISAVTNPMSSLTHQAAGGIISSPRRVLVGEEGPEAIIPLNRLGMGSGGAGVNVNISGGSFIGTNSRDVARMLGDMIIKELQMSHRLG